MRRLPAHVESAVRAAKLLAAPWRGVATAKSTGPRGMNKLEAAWAEVLREREIRGEVLWWRYEGISVRLANGAWYTPDFAVVVDGGEMECHECKGFMREAAHVRLKVAAETFPMRFVLVRREKGAWAAEEVARR